jgi:5-methylcytosine-specific restriction endonuclease McrA
MNDNMKKSAVLTFKSLPERIRDHQITFNIRKELIGISDDIQTLVVSLSRREALFVKYRCTCQYCEKEIVENTDLEIDHVNPLSKGGPDTYENLTLSCFKCNRDKMDKSIDEIGYKIPSTGTYHYNIARKDLLEIDWLRGKFNQVFNRQLLVSDGGLIDVNHKHILNNDKQMLSKEEVEIETEIEEEVEEESETKSEKKNELEEISPPPPKSFSSKEITDEEIELLYVALGEVDAEKILNNNPTKEGIKRITKRHNIKTYKQHLKDFVNSDKLTIETKARMRGEAVNEMFKKLDMFLDQTMKAVNVDSLTTEKNFWSHFNNFTRKIKK